MRNLLTSLRPTDTFNVLLFSGGSLVLADAPLPASEENVRRGVAFIDSQRGSGSTELLPALRRALALPGGEDRARSIRGRRPTATSTVETEAFDVIRENLGQANLFAFGIGSSVNRFLIEGMARTGQGEPFIVTNDGEAEERAEELRRYIEAPVLTKARMSATGFEIYDMEPAGIPDVLAQRPVIVFGKWRGPRRGQLTLRGLAGDGPFERSFELSKVRPDANNAALKYLWARGRIARLDDYQRLTNDADRVQQITQLGLEYHLLTAYLVHRGGRSRAQCETGRCADRAPTAAVAARRERSRSRRRSADCAGARAAGPDRRLGRSRGVGTPPQGEVACTLNLRRASPGSFLLFTFCASGRSGIGMQHG